MKIVFFGSSHFGDPLLRELLKKGYQVPCVVTQPDRQKGRGLHLGSTVIKNTALKYNLKVFQPQDINAKESVKFLGNFDSDLFVVIAYGQILSKEVLGIPKIMPINAHASILPKYRGAAPINWALINGDDKTGVSIIKITQKMDAGPIILKKDIQILQNDTAITLEERLSRVAADLVIDAIRLIENNSYTLTEQDVKKATFAAKLKKQDGLIDWQRSASDIKNLIRGCINWPGAYTFYQGKMLKIFKTEIANFSSLLPTHAPGEIYNITKSGISVYCGKDNLIIEELQIEGKKVMKVEEFISGHRMQVGEILKK